MNDTPRTDEEAGYYDQSGCWKYSTNGECVTSDFACQLERELNEANSEVERLTRKVVELYEGAEEQRQRIKRLEEESESRWNLAESAIASCDEMASRIKRLEKAGDGIVEESCIYQRRKDWDDAKEAKP